MNSKYLYRDQSGEAGTAAEFARSALLARNDRSIARGDLPKSGLPGGSSRRAIPHAVADPSSSAFLLNADLAQKRMVTLEKSAPKLTFSTVSTAFASDPLPASTEQQLGQGGQEFEVIAGGEFGPAVEAVGKDDGDFDDACAVTNQLAEQGGLERIAASAKMVEVAAGEQVSPDASVARGAIAERGQAATEAGQPVPKAAQESAVQGETGRGPAGSKSRANDQAVALIA